MHHSIQRETIAVAPTRSRERAGFGLAAVAVLLRLASDWLFPTGGPLPYQMVQAGLLGLALTFLSSNLDRVYLEGGRRTASIREGLLALPVGLGLGLAQAWLLLRGPQWGAWDAVIPVIANNLFFPFVEELEFRGFMLSWLSRRLPPAGAVLAVALLHMLAHPHYLWQGNFVSAASILFLGLWLGSLTLRTRSLWGAYAAHALFNIFFYLPLVGSGFRR